jgi:intracellular septation protein
VAIAASILQVGLFWLKHRRFETMHVVTLLLILVLGGATLWLQDERFIKWKPTAVNWAFAIAFLISEFIGQKNLVRRMMEAQVKLPDAIWTRLNLSWVAFFASMGVANLYVAFNFETSIWVNFKLFGLMGLTLLFAIGQAFYLARFAEQTEDSGGQP